ncbi:MAG: ABC transporter ATP-binding protein, partial [Bryobacteraceae bacterium]
PSPQRPAPSPAARERRLNPIKLRQMKQRRREIEDEVTRLEVEIADYERALANFTSADETMRVNDLLNARRTDLIDLMTEWEDVAQTIEAHK